MNILNPSECSHYVSMPVAVVVVAHEKNPTLERCLSSFFAIVDRPSDLFFVDNGSSQMLHTWALERFPLITTIRLDENRMFCGGYNVGILTVMEAGYEFVLIANADTEVVNPHFLDELVSATKRWEAGAFFGPLVFYRNAQRIQKTCLDFPSVWRSASQWIPWRLTRDRFEKQPEKEGQVSFLNGVCVLCRVSALKEFGLMDETMGGYVEDTDWAWRARKKGWVSVFTPVPSIIHHEARSGYELYSLKSFLLKRNTVYWYLKIGQRNSAWSYAKASVVLALFRLLASRSGDEKLKHRYFIQRLTRAYSGLLRNEPLGEWFGPPHGIWDGHLS